MERFEPVRPLRLGLIADTHEAVDPCRLIRSLALPQFDRIVHLGDVASSPLVVKMVREFKCRSDWQRTLSKEETLRMEELCRQGKTPVAAYLEARIAYDPALRQRRYEETLERYQEVVGALAEVPNVVVVAGNVDRGWLRNTDIGTVFQRTGVRLVTAPELIHDGSRALVFWPSRRPSSEQECIWLQSVVSELASQLQAKRQVIVLGHEQLFRGPVPSRYVENVTRAGLTASTVPHYEPSPTRRHVASLLRALPPDVQTCFVSGHVHDSQEVIQAGIRYLRNTPGGGLAYRIGGSGTGSASRQVEIFCAPAGRIGELVADEAGFRFRVLE